jgi:hypothetical protein
MCIDVVMVMICKLVCMELIGPNDLYDVMYGICGDLYVIMDGPVGGDW